MSEKVTHLLIHRFAQCVSAMTLVLLIAGGLVTSTDSGLAVPDWPLSYGGLFPPMIGGIAIEHSHRMIAAVTGLLIAMLAGWLWLAESRRWVRYLGYAAVALVITQAILGGLTVLWVLPVLISVAHACLGQTAFCLVACLSVATSPIWHRPEQFDVDHKFPAFRTLCLATTVLLVVQLVLGAVLRHSGGGLVPHLVCAFVVAGMVGWIVWRLRHSVQRSRGLSVTTVWLSVGLAVQMALGLFALFSRDHVAVTTAHVAVGALVLASSCVLTMEVEILRSKISKRVSSPIINFAQRNLVAKFIDYLALTKPRLTALALLTTAAGFLMGTVRSPELGLLIQTLVGAALVGGGANALNQWAERDVDALMRRTKSRPLPSRRLQPIEALVFGLVASGCGLVVLALWVNRLTALLALVTLVSYVGIYTPLKRKTALCTLAGAIPGAMPPLIGFSGARGTLSLEAWVLLAIVFLWQLPHFLAIAWIYRDDYARAGFQMLPVLDPNGASVARQMVLYGLALLPTSLLPTILGVAGPLYFAGALGAGLWFLLTTLLAARWRSPAVANRLFLTSVGYLPAVLVLMVMDKTPL